MVEDVDQQDTSLRARRQTASVRMTQAIRDLQAACLDADGGMNQEPTKIALQKLAECAFWGKQIKVPPGVPGANGNGEGI